MMLAPSADLDMAVRAIVFRRPDRRPTMHDVTPPDRPPLYPADLVAIRPLPTRAFQWVIHGRLHFCWRQIIDHPSRDRMLSLPWTVRATMVARSVAAEW